MSVPPTPDPSTDGRGILRREMDAVAKRVKSAGAKPRPGSAPWSSATTVPPPGLQTLPPPEVVIDLGEMTPTPIDPGQWASGVIHVDSGTLVRQPDGEFVFTPKPPPEPAGPPPEPGQVNTGSPVEETVSWDPPSSPLSEPGQVGADSLTSAEVDVTLGKPAEIHFPGQGTAIQQPGGNYVFKPEPGADLINIEDPTIGILMNYTGTKDPDAEWVFVPAKHTPAVRDPSNPISVVRPKAPVYRGLKTLLATLATVAIVNVGVGAVTGGDDVFLDDVTTNSAVTDVTSPEAPPPLSSAPNCGPGPGAGAFKMTVPTCDYDGTYQVTLRAAICSVGDPGVDGIAATIIVEDSRFRGFNDVEHQINADGTFSDSGTNNGQGLTTVTGEFDGAGNMKGHQRWVPNDGSFVCDQDFTGQRSD